jgi:HK97 family phage prohead protease
VKKVDFNEKEIRAIATSNFEIREKEDGKKFIEGYAIEWEQLSIPLGYWTKFREKFRKGAFSEYLSATDSDTKFLVGHNINIVLGRCKNNTLELKEDDKGLWFSLDLPNTTQGNDTHESVKRGDVDKISVGFKMISQEWDETDETNIVRTVTKANLPEISLTAWPAYEQTSASARSIDDAYKEFKESHADKRTANDKSLVINLRRKKLNLISKL